MRGGQRLEAPPTLEAIRASHVAQVNWLQSVLRSLQPAAQAYEVEVSEGVRKLARCVDADTAH
jgi:hypothetical protein